MSELRWRSLQTAAIWVAGAMVLSACTGQAPEATPASPGGDEPTQAPVSETLTIGLPAGFTGPVTVPATSMQAASEIAIEEINAAGGLDVGGVSYMLDLETADDKCAPEEAVGSLELLLTQRNVDFLVGGLCSSAVIASMQVAEREQVPYIITSASAASIFNTIAEEELSHVFQFSPTEITVAQNAAEVVVELLSPETVAVISEDTDAGRDSDEIFTEYIEEHAPDTEVISHDFIRQDAGNMLSELSRIASAGPDVVFAFFTGVNNEIFVQQKEEVGLEAMLMTAGTEFARPDFVQQHLEATEGALVNIRWAPELADSDTEAFMEKFEAKVDRPVDFFALQQYDAIYMLAAALEDAGTIEAGAVVESLERIEVDGVWGTHSFSSLEDGHTSPWTLVIAQIQDGQHVVIWPEEAAQADVRLPD